MWLLCGCIQWCVYSRSAQFRTVRPRLYQSVYIAFVQSWNPIICPARLLTFTRSSVLMTSACAGWVDKVTTFYQCIEFPLLLDALYSQLLVTRVIVFAIYSNDWKCTHAYMHAYFRLPPSTYPHWHKYERARAGLQVNLFVQSNNGVE